jgi:hypothetical protein
MLLARGDGRRRLLISFSRHWVQKCRWHVKINDQFDDHSNPAGLSPGHSQSGIGAKFTVSSLCGSLQLNWKAISGACNPVSMLSKCWSVTGKAVGANVDDERHAIRSGQVPMVMSLLLDPLHQLLRADRGRR